MHGTRRLVKDGVVHPALISHVFGDVLFTHVKKWLARQCTINRVYEINTVDELEHSQHYDALYERLVSE